MHFIIHFLLMIGMFGTLSSCKKEDPQKPVSTVTVPERQTVVYFVRHAEKATTPGNDPDLSQAGKERAEALNTFFKDKPVEGLFTSPYKRTRQTLEPLALAKGLTIREYSTQALGTLPGIVAAEFANKTVVIAGHSNTLLETFDAFQVQRPVPQITEKEYDYLFKLTLHKDKAPEVEVLHYGKPNEG